GAVGRVVGLPYQEEDPRDNGEQNDPDQIAPPEALLVGCLAVGALWPEWALVPAVGRLHHGGPPSRAARHTRSGELVDMRQRTGTPMGAAADGALTAAQRIDGANTTLRGGGYAEDGRLHIWQSTLWLGLQRMARGMHLAGEQGAHDAD